MGVWTAPLNIVRQHDTRFDTEWKVRQPWSPVCVGCVCVLGVQRRQIVQALRFAHIDSPISPPANLDLVLQSRGCHNDFIITHKQTPSDMTHKYNLVCDTQAQRHTETHKAHKTHRDTQAQDTYTHTHLLASVL